MLHERLGHALGEDTCGLQGQSTRQFGFIESIVALPDIRFALRHGTVASLERAGYHHSRNAGCGGQPQQPSAVPEARSDRKGHGSETSSEGKEHHAQAGRAVSRALRL